MKSIDHDYIKFLTHKKSMNIMGRLLEMLATLAEDTSKSGVLMESLQISGPPEQPSTRSLQAGGLLKYGGLGRAEAGGKKKTCIL